MQKSADLLVIFSVLFLSYSLALFVSAATTFGLKSCHKVEFPFVSISSKKEKFTTVSLEKDGFFYSGEKELEEDHKVVDQEEKVYALDNYVLKGTIVCNQSKYSIAIFKEKKTGKSLAVTFGQELDGFKVTAVHPDRVVLKGKGRTVILKLFRKKEGKTTNSGPKQEERNIFRVERKEIIDEISSGDFLRYISILPWKNPEGLKVTYVNRRSFIYKLGLRPGDVITSINDVHIRTPEDSFSAFEQLKNSDSITITVIRHGKEIKLHYELE